MYIVTDLENQMTVGPFTAAEDAMSFITRIEEMSHNNLTGFEILSLDTPDEWLYENMDDIIMANCQEKQWIE